jgi:hypothetical protein
MSGWFTNRKTKRVFPNPLGKDLDRENTRPPEDVSTVVCERCGSAKDVVIDEGVAICTVCLSAFEAREAENLKIGSTVVGDVSLIDDQHTIKPHTSACSTCQATNRNLCPCHNACYDHRPEGCKFKR